MKRNIDIFFAIFCLLLLFPILIIISICIYISIGRPIFFRQERPGLHGRPFEMVKFRTMDEKRDKFGNLLPDTERLGFIGRFLRSTSLDELPELWNVLKGDMSLVGPRPLLMEYLPLYSAEQNRRHNMKPGVTGWAQINGRNAISWDEKFALDIWYVDNWSLCLDVKILVKTAFKVVAREGINTVDDKAMPPFLGNSSKEANRD
jgi:lipopolysaccharide/colanic/teichoic acid biosynthesis glycosyltransferase